MELLDSVAPARGVDRRTVVSGLAWAVPAIAIAGAAPAVAASTVVGPVPVASATFTPPASGLLTQAGSTGFLPINGQTGHATSSYLTGSPAENSFTSGSDTNGSQAVFTALYTFSMVANATYSVAVKVLTQYGSYVVTKSERQSLDAVLRLGSQSVSLAKVTLPHTNNVTRSDTAMTSLGYVTQAPAAATVSYGVTIFRATTTGLATIQYTFTLDKRASNNNVNDDIWASAPVVTRTA